MSDIVELGLHSESEDNTERYYYCSFSYVFQKTSGFGHIVTKVLVDESNLNADFIPSIVASKVKQNNNLNSVTVLSWQELSEQQYLLEIKERH